MPEDIAPLSPVKRILRRDNTIVLLHRLRQVRKHNRESIKRNRQRIRASPQVKRNTWFGVNGAESSGVAGPGYPATDHNNKAGKHKLKLKEKKEELQIEPHNERETIWSNMHPQIRPKSLTIDNRGQTSEDSRVFEKNEAYFHPRKQFIDQYNVILEQNEDVSPDLTPSRLPQVPEQDVCVTITDTNENTNLCTPSGLHLDVEAITPVLDMEEEARRKVAQYSNPFLQDLYRKERILLMARIMAKVEKVSFLKSTIIICGAL